MAEYVKSKHQQEDVETNRDLYIGGSDLPSILRLNKQYGKSLIEFAKEKLKIIPTQFQGNEYTRYGQFMEPQVRTYVNSMFDYKFKEDSIVDKDRMYRGNCDGIDKKKKMLLEIKTFGSKLDIKLYEPQCQFYMELFDIEECLLVGYKRPSEFYTGISYELDNSAEFFDLEFDEDNVVIYKLKRNREMFEKMEKEIEKFKYLLNCLREEEILNGTKRNEKDSII
jgi:hypothetical protein